MWNSFDKVTPYVFQDTLGAFSLCWEELNLILRCGVSMGCIVLPYLERTC